MLKILSYKNDQLSETSKIEPLRIGTIYARFKIVARRKKILIVDDNNDWRDLLAKFISLFGYEAIEADSGKESIGKAFEMHPDLILMDIYLPDITGDKIIARLKANPATRDIPVVITTALLEQTARNHSLHAGAAEILEKPFGIPTLREVLDRHLTTDESTENGWS